ncbi:hypothetical protein BV20DRAFT_610734 [Pilatotrama ljubarskyi]|nr:hypothetical protein BV20DRAFT_610734 [Pilatotrama ljubarskyi]
MMLNMISQVFGSSRNTHRALFEDIAAELGTAVLPPVLHPEQAEDNEDLDGEDNADEARSEEEEEDGEASDSAQAVDHDRSEEADPMANPWASMLRAWENWPSEEVVIAPDTADEEVPWGRTTTVDGTAASAHPPSSSSTLDPTIPEFVPSSGFSTSRSSSRAPGSSYHLDRLRPLPPGPSHPSDVEEDLSSHHSGLTTGTYSAGRSCTTDRPHSSIDVSSLLLVSPSPDVPSTSDESSDRTSDRAATPSVNSTAALDPTAVQDADPPFMTDGRGRVVWSSTASSRGAREGRRGRAASSSALALPHAKSSADVLTAEESCNGSSRHESPLQRPAGLPHLVRQRSMPSVAGASASDGRALEELPRPAEFVTDGRGRVVFAPSSH